MNMTVATAYEILSQPHLNSPYAVQLAEKIITEHRETMKDNENE